MMRPFPHIRSPKIGLGLLGLIIVILFYGWLPNPQRQVGPTRLLDASDQTIADFFTSLAALDIGEAPLALAALTRAVGAEQREPALWANLAVAQLRLRDLDAAQNALQKALRLAPDATELSALQAEIWQSAGQTELAIRQLRLVFQADPAHLAAAYTLATLLGQLRTPQADEERMRLLSAILDRQPENLRARCDQIRVAVSLQQRETVRQSLQQLRRGAADWPEPILTPLTQAEQSADAGDLQAAARELTFVENLLKPRSEYQQSLSRLGVVSGAAAGTPLRNFLRLRLPLARAAPPDRGLAFVAQPLTHTAARPDLVKTIPPEGERRSTLMLTLSNNSLRIDGSAALSFPSLSRPPTLASLLVADLNFDFRPDLVLAGENGCRLHFARPDGSFSAEAFVPPESIRPCHAVWAVDVEADGDLDLLLSDYQTRLAWLRNNGDLSFTRVADWPSAPQVTQLTAVDLDQDGDVDLAVVDAMGVVSVWQNQRGGRFLEAAAPWQDAQVAIAVGDVNRDGRFDLVSLSRGGHVQFATWQRDGRWSTIQLATWPTATARPTDANTSAQVLLFDFDNNGAVDILASLNDELALWLAGPEGQWTRLDTLPHMFVAAAVDHNADGRLDLAGWNDAGSVVALNRGRANYQWIVINPRANTAEGDQRINSFGIGGRVEVRAGRLVQAAVIDSPELHFGLGEHPRADVARIVWPNGAVQAEFDVQAQAILEARQRLKGSCPWVFAFNGEAFQFTKDFLWRSPLGLRINAQDTAGITQTEDWIKLSGKQLVAVDGRHELRITGELWETLFFDHVKLLAVDHPPEVEAFVDERFVPTAPLARTIVLATAPRPFALIVDHQGRNLDAILATVDGAYADCFRLGRYQGVAEEHWIEFELPEKRDTERDVLLVGQGWVYPTDSSINIAISQTVDVRPHGLILDHQLGDGTWLSLSGDLGFPAGKNKDVVIQLPRSATAAGGRFRLRTNMEVYWDALGWSYAASDVVPRLTPLSLSTAELRYRGFSKLQPTDRRRPDMPRYEVESTVPRWLDLEGYYTRFGDVVPLLREVDDRYVIMNAGDELLLAFEDATVATDGWRRDYVLMGDGWVKDGDLNTAFSRWVRPLPSHDDHQYAGPLVPLLEDPVYSRQSADWMDYHTRYVTPSRFQQGLWPSSPHDRATRGSAR